MDNWIPANNGSEVPFLTRNRSWQTGSLLKVAVCLEYSHR